MKKEAGKMKKCFYFLLVAGLVFLNNVFCWAGLIENGSFELVVEGKNPVANSDPDGIAKWMRWGFENNESTDLFAHSGRRAFKAWYNGGIYQDFSKPITPGERYKGLSYMFAPSTDQLSGDFYGLVKLEWLDEKGEILFDMTEESEHFDSRMPPDTWKLISVEGVAPNAAVSGRITLEFRGEGNGSGIILWDDADVREVEPK